MTPLYYVGSDLPDLAITWLDEDGDPIDFSTGYTFSVKVGKKGESAEFTKTANIVGDAAAPNVVVSWSPSAELNDLDPGRYLVQVTATRTADSRQRIMQGTIQVKQALA